MAKQLYDYWFVQFDFPNEEGKPYKSSGGKMVWNDKLKREIPEGWYADNICRIADILSGGTPSKQIDSYWQNGNIPFFGPTDYAGAIFQLNTAEHITSDGLKHCASSLFEEGVVIITARGSIGKLVIIGTPMAMNQSCYAFRSRNNEFEYLYFLTAQLIEHLKAKGSGSVFKSIITTDIENSILSIADETTITLFTSTIRPLMNAIKENTKQIEVLTKQRDELLPLLMNGQVSVNYHLANKNNVVNTLFRAKLLTLYKIGLNMSENLKLWDIIDSFVSGDWGNEEESPEAPCCVSCIRGADIVPICNSDFDNIPIRYISNRSFTTHCLQEGDIIVEKSGGSPTQSTGRVVYISKELLAAKNNIVCSNFCVAFRVKPEWNSLYIYYYLRNVYNAGVFFNFEGKTSGIKNLDIETAFKAIPIKTIAMETQISIATAISCLDKKIALNRALNDNLEAMAKQLYDYWFVQFDFPNEEGKPYKSSGGKMVWNEKLKREIPAGWNVKSIFNELSVQYGYPFSTDQFTEEQTNVPVVRIRDILDNSISAYSHEGTDDKYRLNEGDLLVGMDGNFHMNYWIDNTAYLNQRSVRLRATERSTVSVVQARYDIAPYIKAKELRAKGSTVGHLSDKDLKELYVIVGTSNKLREAFDSLLNRIIANRKENLLLIKQRDELLPLLMNGQVSVNYHLSHD